MSSVTVTTAASDAMIITTTNDTPGSTHNSTRSLITVTKPIPYTFDLGNLLCHDANPVEGGPDPPTEAILLSTARDATQALLNQLLTSCPIQSTPAGVHLTLPPATMRLPREKPLPTPKQPTKWERFAAKKGIKAHGRRDERGANKYDDKQGEGVRKWARGNREGDVSGDWLVEVDEKKEAQRAQVGKEGDGVRGEARRERKERVKRQERKERANEKRNMRATA